MNSPKISVIIPVYNGIDYIKECLDSIVNQTLKDIEVICVNDGSTDNSLSILQGYASKDDRIKIINKENEGQGYARKVGLNIADGEYIMFCDQDDKFASNDSFQIAFDRIEKYNTDIAIFKFAYWDEKEAIDTLQGYLPSNDIFKHSDEKFLVFSYFAPWLKIYRKSFLYKYNDWYFPKFAFIEDPPLHFQVLLRANNITYIDKILYFHRTTNPNSITQRKKYTDKHARAFCDFSEKIKNILIDEKVIEDYKEYFIYFIVTQSFIYIEKSDFDSNVIASIQTFIKNNGLLIKSTIVNYPLNKNLVYPMLSAKDIFYVKSMLRFSNLKIIEYLYKKYCIICKENLQNRNLTLKQKNDEIQKLCNQNQIQEQVIKRLQNSWSYRIGRLFTYPLSIPLELYKYICDYNLIKKSDLFDSEYYLTNNEDVKKAKMNPIKHYLQFGWKEGRNPSSKFNGNEYLNKRPDVRVAGICPLIHYLKFGKEEK